MQKVKTLFIFTFMVVILYGAYLVLYKGPAPTPKEVEEHLANGGADPLELNLGEQISADELLAGITDQLPLDEGRDDITAADNGEFISPAADALGGQNDLPETADVSGLKLPTQPVAESSALQDNPITPTTETGSDANTNLDDRGGSFQIISPAGSAATAVVSTFTQRGN